MKTNRTIAVLLVMLVSWLNVAALTQQPQTVPDLPASAGTQPAASAAAANPAPEMLRPSKRYLLKDGTEVKLKFANDLTSKSAVVGDPVELVLDEDLKVDDAVIVAKGARALGTITNAKKSGAFGKGGELNMKLEYLKAGDTKIKLRGLHAKAGDDKVGATVALTVAFGVVGFLKHGKQAEVKAGTPLLAYVNEDAEVPPVPQTEAAVTQ